MNTNFLAIKKIINLSVPMSITQVINVASSFFCMAMLARLGHEVLAASALIFSSQSTFRVMGMSVLFPISLLIGHDWGAKNYARIGSIMRQGWLIALVVSIILIILFLYMKPILLGLGQQAPLVAIVQQFFNVYVWAIIPFMLLIVNQQLFFAMQKQHLALIMSLISMVALLVVAYVFIFGKWGMPALGVTGLGIAMIAQGVVGFLFSTLCLLMMRDFKVLALFRKGQEPSLTTLKHMFKIGWPISLQISGEMPIFFLNSVMIGCLGAHALAASQVVTQYLFLCVVPIFAFSQALGILVSQAAGRNDKQEIKQVGNMGILIGFITAAIFALIFLTLPKLLASFYFDVHNPSNAVTLHLTVILFAMVAISQLFDSTRNVTTGALRGIFDTRFPMFTGIILLWLVGLPLSYSLALLLHLGIVGVALGSAMAAFIGASILLWRWNKLTNKT